MASLMVRMMMVVICLQCPKWWENLIGKLAA